MSGATDLPEAAMQLSAKLLCVDDEPNILSSLRRLFRTQGYQVFTAESGAAGLKVLETESIDLVISDMRMPEMGGARFLEYVRERWPETVRLLLTGYAAIQSSLDAINRGEIYRYITKPWDENDILLIVRHALERKALEHEKRRLEALTHLQNQELKTLNASLEAKVEERTAEIKIANEALTAANEKLKTNFLTSIKVFSNLIEMRKGHLAGHSRRVADLARKIALNMGLDEHDTQEIFVAGLLHNIGKIGFSDELLSMPIHLMSGENLALYRQHPVHGEHSLMPLEDLRGAAAIVRAQLERYDGKGFPDSLANMQIPVGARILALASDYDHLQAGTFFPRRYSLEEAKAYIQSGRNKLYDAKVVDAFLGVMSDVVEEVVPDGLIAAADLRPDMIISRDLITPDGLLLLSAGHVLEERLIEKIIRFEADGDKKFTIYVHMN